MRLADACYLRVTWLETALVDEAPAPPAPVTPADGDEVVIFEPDDVDDDGDDDDLGDLDATPGRHGGDDALDDLPF